MPPLPPGCGSSVPVGWHSGSWPAQEGSWSFDGATAWAHQDLRSYGTMPYMQQPPYLTPAQHGQQQQHRQHQQHQHAHQQLQAQQHRHHQQRSQQQPHNHHQQLSQQQQQQPPLPHHLLHQPPFHTQHFQQQQQQQPAPSSTQAAQLSPAALPRLPKGGVIFLCDPRTEEECLRRGLFGLPATQTAIVRAIVPESTLLFLFNVRTRHVLGIFRATTWPQQNLEPHAWGEDPAGGSRFPLQVRVRLDFPSVLCLTEEQARPALEYHGTHNRFDLQMGEAAAALLAQLFSQLGEPHALAGGARYDAGGVAGGPPPPHAGMGGARYDAGMGGLPGLPSTAAGRRSGEPGGSVGAGVGSPAGGGGGSVGSGWLTPSRGQWPVAAESGGGQRPSGERQSGDRSRRNGLVFICDPTTEEECLSRRLLGLPKSQSSLLSKLADSSLLFLFNVRTRQMLGVFSPDGAAGMEIEPAAFGGDSRFPVQVRFVPLHPATLRPTSTVLAIPEKAVEDVLRYRNASTRFDLLLRGRAVDRIVAAFGEMGAPVPMPPPLPPPAASAPVASQPHPPPLPPSMPPPPAARAPDSPPPDAPALPPEPAAADEDDPAAALAAAAVAAAAKAAEANPTATAGDEPLDETLGALSVGGGSSGSGGRGAAEPLSYDPPL